VSKGKIVIFIKRVIFCVLSENSFSKKTIFTKLLLSWGNYLEMVIIRYFDGLSV